jgi:hypothetical protein
LADLSITDDQQAALKKEIAESAESISENQATELAVLELDRLSGVPRPISEVKGPIGGEFKMPPYSKEPIDKSYMIELAQNLNREGDFLKGIDDPMAALTLPSRGNQTKSLTGSGVRGMGTIWQWVNQDGQYWPTNCGTAAMATVLTRYERGVRFHPSQKLNPVRRIENDWLGPDVAFGQGGTSRWRMEEIARKYGFNYGWGIKSQLDETIAAAKPVAVMLDIANDKAGSAETFDQWGFHWVVVYAYDKKNYYVTNWPGKGAIPKAKFHKGWEENVVAKAMGINSRFLLISPK